MVTHFSGPIYRLRTALIVSLVLHVLAADHLYRDGVMVAFSLGAPCTDQQTSFNTVNTIPSGGFTGVQYGFWASEKRVCLRWTLEIK